MKKEYYRLKLRSETIGNKMKVLIIRAVKENNGRITFCPTNDDDDYPLTTSLPIDNEISFISVTDVYLDNEGLIRVDGIQDNTLDVKIGLEVIEDNYDNILYFIGYVLHWFDAQSGQFVIDDTNSSIMEMACELAEKEMVDGYGKLPEYFANKNGEYTDFYQNIFNPIYDKYYNRIAELADFEYK